MLGNPKGELRWTVSAEYLLSSPFYCIPIHNDPIRFHLPMRAKVHTLEQGRRNKYSPVVNCKQVNGHQKAIVGFANSFHASFWQSPTLVPQDLLTVVAPWIPTPQFAVASPFLRPFNGFVSPFPILNPFLMEMPVSSDLWLLTQTLTQQVKTLKEKNK